VKGKGTQIMKYIPIENLLPKAGYSIYALVRMASMRALELAEGRKCLVDNVSTDKLTTLAMQEIFEGKIVLKNSKQHLAKEETKSPEKTNE